MRFSIMISVYNAEPYLPACVDSVLSQSEKDFELILVDDGSTDKSDKICDGFAEQDKRVRVFHTENQGVFLARQFAESHAKGDYLLHVDADDLVEPDLLQTLSVQIDTHHPDLLVYDFSTFRGDAAPVLESFWDGEHLFEGEALQELYALVFSTRFNTLCNKCFHRRYIQSAPEYERFGGLRHGEDLLRSAHIVFAAEKVLYIPKSFYLYRMGVGSTCRFDPDSLRMYDKVDSTLRALLSQKVSIDEAWERQVNDLCRKQLDNYLRLLAGSDLSLGKAAALLKKAEGLDVYNRALSASQNDIKYRLLRKRLYIPLLMLHRGKRWLRA